MGPEYLENGMTTEQMILFYNAITTIESNTIGNNIFAFGTVMSDKEGHKKNIKQLQKMQFALDKHLLDLIQKE